MGLLTAGQPLAWSEIQAALEQIKTYGVDQLIHVYQKCKDRQGDSFTWGDEVKHIHHRLYDLFPLYT